MPTYSNEVPDDPRGAALPIRRTPPRKPLVAIVTSQDMLGCYTHYWNGRTQPCEKPACDPCSKGMPYRWHAYFGSWEISTALHFLFEVTAQAAQHFVTYRNAHGTLRGCKFEATRWRANPNGRVLLRSKPHDFATLSIPKPPDLVACLAILWGIPTSDFKTGYAGHDIDQQVTEITKNNSQPRWGQPQPIPDPQGNHDDIKRAT